MNTKKDQKNSTILGDIFKYFQRKNQEIDSVSQHQLLKQVSGIHQNENLDEQTKTIRDNVSLKNYILSSNSLWFWTIITTAVVSTILIFVIPESLYPVNFIRYVLGSFFSLFIPGYVFVKILFPVKELDFVSQIALSIGLSIILVSILGLFLNYTPLGVRIIPLAVSLLVMTFAFSMLAIKREYSKRLTKPE